MNRKKGKVREKERESVERVTGYGQRKGCGDRTQSEQREDELESESE